MERKIALITGATSGIGKACALILAKNGYDLIVTGRRTDRLEAFKQEVAKGIEVLPLTFDVRDKEAVFDLLGNLPERWKGIDVLINNAGNAHGMDPIQTGSTDDWDAMMDIN
ncbi:MAG: SDR family NAD(P)-dependent oxidoreductase, partial [Cyclobacteriaceae bacterium]|nr:SDR family NAD(P)-dependent oxidoreductase [Cyclobacteriaceae bacterium]